MTTQRTHCRILHTALALSIGLCGASALASESSDKARAALEKGDLRTATIELKNALQKDPNDSDARLVLGKVYLRSGNGAAAEKEIRTALDLGADASLWRLDLVEALILQGKFDDAMQRLDAAGQLSDADTVRALVLRGNAAVGREQPDEARDYYQRALDIDPDDQDAGVGLLRLTLRGGDKDASAKAADAFLARFPDNADALLIRAELHRAAGENSEALDLFDRAIKTDPRNTVARLGRATALIGLKDLDGAREGLDQVDKDQPNIPMTSYLRGVIAFQEKDWRQAAEELQRVLAAVPGHLQSQLLLGIIRYSEGQLETADELLSNVVGAAPGNVQARKVLAATRIKQREPGRAVEVLEPMAQDGDPQTLALLGSAYMLQGDLERGQEWLNRAVEDAPNVAALRTQLALSLLAGGETDKAIGELQTAVDLGQDILQADVLLVLAHLKNKEFEQALEASRSLEQRHPDSPIPYNLTGLALMAKGDLPAARERFEKALSVNPQFATAAINLARIDVAGKDLDAAQRRYEQVLKTNPKHLGALLGLAALAEQRRDTDALVAALERAQEANPSATQPGLLLARFYVTRSDYSKALTVASDLARRFPDNDSVLQMLGRTQTLGGQVPNAIRTFDQLLSKNPKDPQLHYLAGGARWKDKDFAGAKASFRSALELKPDFLEAQVALASVSLDAGDTDGALNAAKALQTDFPDSAVGYRVEGSIRNAMRDPVKAAQAYKEAYARQKSGISARQLAESLRQADQTKEAVEVLEGWVADNPKDLDTQAALGLLYQQAQRPKDAIAIYEQVMSQATKKNPLLLNNLAWLYQEEGDARALSVAKEAYDLAPNRPEIADTYGWVLYNSGQKDDGLRILQQAYLAVPTQTEIGYHVAAALAGVGRKDESIQILRKILRESPTSEHAADAAELLKKLGG